MEGTCGCAVLRLPNILRWAMAYGRLLVLLALHTGDVSGIRKHRGMAETTDTQ